MNNRFGLPLVLVLFSSLLIVRVEGHNPTYTINAVLGEPPTIDGLLEYGEWSDASSVSFNQTIVYLKQDGMSLYVGFNVSDSTNDEHDQVFVFIDVNHDGGIEPQVDDRGFAVERDGDSFELHGKNVTSSSGGWTAAVHETTTIYTVELNITYQRIDLHRGVNKTLGLFIETYDYSNPYVGSFWPPLSLSEILMPSKCGDLTSDVNWVAEFPSFLILPLFMTLTLVVVIVSRRKHSMKLR